MTKFHSTVSRREFMKGLGMGSAGLGAAAAVAPGFHDLDEVMNSPMGVKERFGWWVKEREYLDPTTEIQWERLERFDASKYDNGYFNAAAPGTTSHLTAEHNAERNAARAKLRVERLKANDQAGYTLKDYALCAAGWLRPYANELRREFLGDPKKRIFGPMTNQIPVGTAKWEGTPEENAKMMRVFCRSMGGARIAFGEVNEKTKKLINLTNMPMYDGPKAQIVFEDVEEAYQAPGKWVIPNKCKSIVVCEILMQREEIMMANSEICRALVGKAYDQIEIFKYRISAFLNSLGYEAAGGGGIFGIFSGRPALGVLFGLGELGRIHNLVTPDHGPLIRCTLGVLTDLPLPVTNPVDFGANRFCDTCKKCGESCPNGAIYMGEADFLITPKDSDAAAPDSLAPDKFNNSPGYRRWPLNHFACASYWRESDASCGICLSSCVFAKDKIAGIHDLVKPVVSTTPIFNSFFYQMDSAFKYGPRPQSEWADYWETDKPIIGANY